MNSHDAALLRCTDCGWTVRGWDVPEGAAVADVMWVHRQGACASAPGRGWRGFEAAGSEAL
ncbi:MAG: hypothetical protein QOJ26_1867 [Thermoplasmata archaeon]|jgi:hypothetical protein|nr:hypothetical protein [Thermoplasmata archaeon]